jgi:hypothetical protein
MHLSTSHLKGLSLECVFSCLFSWPASTNPLLQIVHL